MTTGDHPVTSPPASSDPLLTVAQLAELEQITERRLRRLITHHGLPTYNIGGGIRIRWSEYQAWLETNRRLCELRESTDEREHDLLPRLRKRA